jgi:ParB family chromosome partitioning protein
MGFRFNGGLAHLPKLELPTDFAEQIAKCLSWKPEAVNQAFTFEEAKDGFFIAQLRRKGTLSALEFKTMCALVRDLGGEYLRGTGKFRIPGPCAKKRAPEVKTEQKPSVAPPVLTYDKSKPDIPNIKFIPIEAIKIPPFLPTRELISHERLSEIRESIKKHGQRYPIKVRRFNSDYELIDGYLRLKSVEQLGWKGILAEIKDATDKEVLTESIITNKHRIEEDPITLAKKFDILLNVFGYTQEKLEDELGIDRTTISHYLGMLRLPKDVQRSIALGDLSLRHGLTLFTVNNVEMQSRFAREAIDEKLTIQGLEERIQESQPKPSASSTPVTAAEREEYKPSESEALPTLEEDEGNDEEGSGQARERTSPKQEPVDIGEFECPECHQQFIVEHLSPSEHRLKVVRTL